MFEATVEITMYFLSENSGQGQEFRSREVTIHSAHEEGALSRPAKGDGEIGTSQNSCSKVEMSTIACLGLVQAIPTCAPGGMLPTKLSMRVFEIMVF